MSDVSAAMLAHDSKTPALASLLVGRDPTPIRNVLVVGCGSGVEAALLGRELACTVTGIDIEGAFDQAAATMAHLEVGDATSMRFEDGAFDFVFSYHALEHIPDYRRALREMSRVLRVGGRFCIGTPNKDRLIGYLGSKDATLAQKLTWNAADWRARLAGRFSNEAGAHAGFTSEELERDLTATFGEAVDISMDYYRAVYAHRHSQIDLLRRIGIARFLLPSIYFIGHNARQGL